MKYQVALTILVLSYLSCNLVSATNNFTQYNESIAVCSSWYHFNSATNECQCYQHIKCTEQGAFIPIGHCMTYDESSKLLSYVLCHYLHDNSIIVDDLKGIKLPSNISELNEYMCGPLNRKGSVCSECIDGFGPSLAPLGYECSNCTSAWHNLPFYILMELGPTTLFYVLILVLQINFTSAPMTGFIMYSQIVLFEILFRNNTFIRTTLAEFPSIVRAIATFYGIWNLDFLRHIISPFCVSSKLKLIDLIFIQYICASYPFFLIAITWVCIELHGRNFKLLVWLWSPFRRCMVHIHKSSKVKPDMVNTFSSFYLLSCSKLFYQATAVMACHHVSVTSTNTNVIVSVVSVTEDLSVHCYSPKHLAFSIVSLFVIVLLVFFPVLVLMLYPTKICSQCLSKCRMNGRPTTILFTFTEKFHSSYRNGLDGKWDMRSISGIHFLIRLFCFTGWRILLITRITNHGSFFKILGLAAAFILVAYLKPYKKAYMNIIDVILLCYTALLYLISEYSTSSIISIVYLFIPMIAFVVSVNIKLMAIIIHKVRDSKSQRSYKREQRDTANANPQQILISSAVQHTSYGSI